MHYLFSVVGDYELADGIAVALLYAAEPLPVAVYLLDERECLGPTVELSVAAKSVGVVFGLTEIDEK